MNNVDIIKVVLKKVPYLELDCFGFTRIDYKLEERKSFVQSVQLAQLPEEGEIIKGFKIPEMKVEKIFKIFNIDNSEAKYVIHAWDVDGAEEEPDALDVEKAKYEKAKRSIEILERRLEGEQKENYKLLKSYNSRWNKIGRFLRLTPKC